MTSVDWATRLVNECGPKEEKSDPRLTKAEIREETYHAAKKSVETLIRTAATYF